MSPSTALAGAPVAVPVTFTGTGFAAGAYLTAPPGVTFSKVTIQSSTTITANMNVAKTAPKGTNLPIKVTNKDAGGYGFVTAGLLTIT